MTNIERGDILLVEFDPSRGSEIRKTRPAVVITNDIANKKSPVLVVVPITSQNADKIRVFDAEIKNATGLSKVSKVVVSQMRAMDRSRIKKHVGKISNADLQNLDLVLKRHLGLDE